MALLTDDWDYPVVEGDLDPNDPLVNTGSEYMFQMATIAYHVLHGTETVVLEETVEYDGETFEAGEYEVVINEVGSPERVGAGLGGYWTDFDRMHPLEGPARAQAWSGTAHGLVGELGVGTVTHSTLQMGLALGGTLAAIGLTVLVAGLGLVWATKEEKATKPEASEPGCEEGSRTGQLIETIPPATEVGDGEEGPAFVRGPPCVSCELRARRYQSPVLLLPHWSL